MVSTSSTNNTRPLKIVVDFRCQSPYPYSQMNHQIAVIPQPIKTLWIKFEFIMETVPRDPRIFSILSFDSLKKRLAFCINGLDEFWIIHHYRTEDGIWHETALLTWNVVRTNSGGKPTAVHHHFSIFIEDQCKVRADIDGYSVVRTIEKRIFPENETMYLWRDTFKVGTVTNLIIESQSK